MMMKLTLNEPMIKKEDLIDLALYEGKCRGATVARWDAEESVWYYDREKFGHRFRDHVPAFEDAADSQDYFHATKLIPNE